jgi:transposase
LGHEVIVARARNVRLISESNRKDDRLDARTLARLARIDPGLLGPVRHRSAPAQIHLTVIRARAALVSTRTALVNAARGLTKSYGERLKKCSTERIYRESSLELSHELRQVLDPLLREIESLNERIAEYDRRIEQIAKEVHPEVALLKQVKGIGTLIALTYVLTIDDPQRFRRSRDAGCFHGLRLGRRNSGQSEPQLHISKEGDCYLRTLLVQGAHYILGPLEKTAIYGAGDSDWLNVEERMPRSERWLPSHGNWPCCYTSFGRAGKSMSHCGTTAKR